MPKVFKKFIFSFLTVLIVLFSFAPYFSPAKAQTWYNQSFQEWYGKVYDPTNPSEIFGERYTAGQVQWIVYGLMSFLINTVVGPKNVGAVQCLISNAANPTTCAGQLSTLLTTTNTQNQTLAATKPLPKQNLLSLVFLSDRPISGISYVREKIQKLNLVSVANAQTIGFGFSALTVVQNMWIKFRDIAFGLFVLVAIVFAFMIMFRVKISPQLVISVQSALPKIIVALILVTFSYAIAGFLIDLMYLVIGLVSLVTASLIPVTWYQTMQYKAADVFNLLTVGPITQGVGSSTASAGGIFGLLGLYLTPLILILLIVFVVAAVIGAVGVETVVAPVVAIIFLILIVIVVVILLWMAIKIIWGLLKAFANILLLTIFAPIQFALGPLVPSFGFGKWVRSYVSNLSVFVVTGVLALFAWIFLNMAWVLMFTGPDLTLSSSGTTASPWPPLLGSGGSANLLFIGVSFVIFTLIPKANELIQSLLSGKPFAYGSGIGEAFGPVKSAWGITGAPIMGGIMKKTGEKIAGDRQEEIMNIVNKILPKKNI